MIVALSRCVAWGYCRLLSRVNGKLRAKGAAVGEVFDFHWKSDKKQPAASIPTPGGITKGW
jgi:hypothetical protein